MSIANATRTRNRSGAGTLLLTPVDRWTAEQWTAALARAQRTRIGAIVGPMRILGPDRSHTTYYVASASHGRAHDVQVVRKGEVMAIACDCREGYPDVAPCQHMAAALWINCWHWVPQVAPEDWPRCPQCSEPLHRRWLPRDHSHAYRWGCVLHGDFGWTGELRAAGMAVPR